MSRAGGGAGESEAGDGDCVGALDMRVLPARIPLARIEQRLSRDTATDSPGRGKKGDVSESRQ